MKKNFAFTLMGIGTLLLFACSKDEPDPNDREASIVLELTTFADTGSDILQMDLSTASTEPITSSLTESFDLQFLENTRNQFDFESVAYFTWQDQESRVFFKDLATGIIYTESDICGFQSEGNLGQ